MQQGQTPGSELELAAHERSDADSLAFIGRDLSAYDYKYDYVDLHDATGTPHRAA